MNLRFILTIGLVLSLTLTACSSSDNTTTDNFHSQKDQDYAEIGSGAELVEFPNYEQGIMYTTVDRVSIHEEMWINSKEAIEAAQNGEEFPSGTVITLVGHRDGEIYQILVMEKRTGWGSQYSPEERNGEFEYQHFTAAGEVADDNIARCLSCHANQSRDQYVNTYDDILDFDSETVASMENSSTETSTATIPIEEWEVSEISAHMIDSKDDNKVESQAIDGQEKGEIIEEFLLTMHLQQFES